MRDYIERLRMKPESARRTIALMTAGAVTAVVALGWVIALVSSDSLAVAPQTDNDFDDAFAGGQERFDALAGAASAFMGAGRGEPGVTIVEEERSSTLDRNEPAPEERVIHF